MDAMEIDELDITSLLDSLSLMTESNSQLPTDDKVNTLKQLVKLTPAQLESNLSVINFPSWTDEMISDLFNECMDIPSTTLVYLLSQAVYPKVVLLQSSAPRLIMNSLLQITKKEGKCVLDGLVLPLLFYCDIERPQLEMILKLTSDAFNATQRFHLLECMIDDGEHVFMVDRNKERKYLRPWQDTTFQIVQTLLSTQPYISFTKACLFDLLATLQTRVQSNPKDKGSMQLLLLLTSKYTQAILDHQALDTVEAICQTSTMFLKRAVLGQITSMKKQFTK